MNDPPRPRIDLSAAGPEAKELWRSALALVDALDDEVAGAWTLVGGLMVQLHVIRYGDGDARPTDDLDVLGDSRARPSATERIARVLERLKFTLNAPIGVDLGTAYRFTRGEEIVDVLGSDGTRKAPKTLGQYETIRVKGGTQALERTERVAVVMDSEEADLRCPTLLGAILLKARAITSPQRDQDREDLIRLLLCVDDPRAMNREVSKTERSWLRKAGPPLRLDHEDELRDAFSRDQLAAARAAYALLLQGS